MANRADGMNYIPPGMAQSVVEKGEFPFAAIGLDHGHIYGMCEALTQTGAQLKWVYDSDAAKMKAFAASFPGVALARSEEEVLADASIRLVAAAAVPSDRCALGLRVMDAGKDYFTDKTPMTKLEHVEAVRAKVAETGKKYAVYYSERIHTESGVYVDQLIREGAIGRVIQVLGMGPHRLNAPQRPDWFFRRENYGGILCDIGSHQIEQFLTYSGAKTATVLHSKIGNYNHPEHPELDDFGDATLLGDNGATNYFRVDWFTPDGLKTWGDGRMFILGTEGFIERRAYTNIGTAQTGDHVFLANATTEKHIEVAGKVGFPFFGQLVLDCLHRTENAMTQEHALTVAELCIKSQLQAITVA